MALHIRLFPILYVFSEVSTQQLAKTPGQVVLLAEVSAKGGSTVFDLAKRNIRKSMIQSGNKT
jgi:hypothetical protein